jgi:prepilin-type N-terminal cleavage/methylation domain-containing protein
MKNNFKKAFSLIEISIVILVVGILIAGISKGVDLVYDMRLATARALTDKAPMFGMENLEMWLETTSENSLATGVGTSFTNVANPPDKKEIGRWNDINPTLIDPNYKNHAVQGTLGYQPLYIQDGINGLPALLFDGFDDFFSAIDGKTNFSEFTIFLILHPKFKSNINNNFSNIINASCPDITSGCRSIGSSTGYLTYNASNPTIWISINYNATTINAINPIFSYGQIKENNPGGTAQADVGFSGYSLNFTKEDIPRIAEVNHGSSKVKVFMSSQLVSVTANPSPLLTGNSYIDFRIGTQKFNGDLAGYGNRNYKGFIGEIILFGRSLNDQESQLIENYLSEKWRIKL